jgi:uncharacterized protein (TIGR02996 family)
MKDIFEKILKENRYDTLTRNAYADWLEENGFDDEAVEQRCCTSSEWIEADKWMHDFASKCGETCTSGWSSYDNQSWTAITYEDVIQAGHDYIDREDYFTQIGSEDAKTLMYNTEINIKYWECWCIITGRNKPREPKYGLGSAPFSCSC